MNKFDRTASGETQVRGVPRFYRPSARVVSAVALAMLLLAPSFAPAASDEDDQQDSDEKPPASHVADLNMVPHDFDDFGGCGFWAKRGVRWKQDFADGSKLEVRCEPDPGSLLPGFHLWYAKGRTRRIEIGRCIFHGGLNFGRYYTSTDPAVKGALLVEWSNSDGGKNDGGHRSLDMERDQFTGPEEPYFDVVEWVFDVPHKRLESTSDKYRYLSAAHVPYRANKLDDYVGAVVPELRRTFVKEFHD